MQLVKFMKDRIRSLFQEEDGQDTFEVLLIIGVVVVAVVVAAAALADPFVGGVIDGVCGAIFNVLNVTGIDCTP